MQDVRRAYFEDELLARLVLAEDSKMLVRAFVAQQGHSAFKDVLAGKRGVCACVRVSVGVLGVLGVWVCGCVGVWVWVGV